MTCYFFDILCPGRDSPRPTSPFCAPEARDWCLSRGLFHIKHHQKAPLGPSASSKGPSFSAKATSNIIKRPLCFAMQKYCGEHTSCESLFSPYAVRTSCLDLTSWSDLPARPHVQAVMTNLFKIVYLYLPPKFQYFLLIEEGATFHYKRHYKFPRGGDM